MAAAPEQPALVEIQRDEQPPRPDRDKPRGRRRDRWQRDAGVMEHGDNALGFGAFLPAFMQGPARALPLSTEAAPGDSAPRGEEEE
jgi:hypothetical protein